MNRTSKPNLQLQPQPQHNHLLAALSPDVQGRLFPHLELVHLPLRAILYESNKPMHHVYFPTNSAVSLQYMLENGASAAVSVVGNEGLLGISVLLTGEGTSCLSMVQSAGYAYRLPKSRAKEEFNRHGQFLVLMLRYTQSVLTQVSQTAACNRHHSVIEQLGRWLLISLERLSHNNLTMTHEYIANMLGVRRESITAAAAKLQRSGVITYTRGLISVIDRHKLESLACECYRSVKTENDLLLDYLPQRRVVENTDPTPTAALAMHQVISRKSEAVTSRRF